MRARLVQELAVKYARYIDDKAFDKVSTIMSDDVVVASPGFECNSLDEFMEQLKFLDSFSATLHMVGNQFGEWEGETYSGETYCVASHIYEQDGVQRKLEMGIRYQDDIAPMDGTYKYTRRYLNVLWEQDLPLKD